VTETVWTTLIICVFLTLLAVLTIGAFLPYLWWGSQVLKEHGKDELAAFTEYVRAWPHPLKWIGDTARAILGRPRPGADDEDDAGYGDQTPDESPDEAA
jgi:hypothetical protein